MDDSAYHSRSASSRRPSRAGSKSQHYPSHAGSPSTGDFPPDAQYPLGSVPSDHTVLPEADLMSPAVQMRAGECFGDSRSNVHVLDSVGSHFGTPYNNSLQLATEHDLLAQPSSPTGHNLWYPSDASFYQNLPSGEVGATTSRQFNEQQPRRASNEVGAQPREQNIYFPTDMATQVYGSHTMVERQDSRGQTGLSEFSAPPLFRGKTADMKDAAHPMSSSTLNHEVGVVHNFSTSTNHGGYQHDHAHELQYPHGQTSRTPIDPSAEPKVDLALVGQDTVAEDLAGASLVTVAKKKASGSNEEKSTKLARSDPLYSAARQADNLFHCPFKSEENCRHKPTKLKCTYDKYVDSHLKPFRCKIAACQQSRFSSTACLLRHEREAHGMHGHGEKPNLCKYHDCDRSKPGNGFPRRFNLWDHMKRVHGHESDGESTGSPDEDETTESAQTPQEQGRKRKSPAKTDEPRVKRPRKAAAADDIRAQAPLRPENGRDQKIRLLRDQWTQFRLVLLHRVQHWHGPLDNASQQQINEVLATLNRICQEIRELG